MKSMSELNINEKAIIGAIPNNNPLKRRFYDLGLVENTKITCVAISPLGDPKAYLIRGAVIAIRKKDCQDICLKEFPI